MIAFSIIGGPICSFSLSIGRKIPHILRDKAQFLPTDMSSLVNYPSMGGMTTKRLLSICLAANLGGVLVGYHIAVFSGILEMEHFKTAMTNDVIDAKTKSIITVSLVIGAMISAVPAGSLCDTKGRRKTLLITCSLFAASAVVIAVANEVLVTVIGRIIAGFGFGIANIVCPMYTAEISPAAYRGLLVSLYQLAINIGILFAQVANTYFALSGPWTGSIHIGFWIAMFSVVVIWILVPESPTWSQRRKNSSENLEIEHGELHDDNEGTSDVSLGMMLRDGSARKRLVIGVGLAVAQQLTGINAVIFFGPALVSDVLHLEGKEAPFRSAAIVGLGNVIATFIAMFVVERMGRRKLLLLSTNPIIISLVVIGMIRQGVIRDNYMIGLGSLLLFVFGFQFSYGPLTFVICSEIFPVRYKGIGMSVCSFVLSAVALLIGASFLPILEAIGGRVYYIFGCFVGAAGVFIYWFVPETKNLTLEEISRILEF